MKNKSNSNTLGISGAYVTNWPKAPKIGDVKPATIVTRLARGNEAENILLDCTMNNYTHIEYCQKMDDLRVDLVPYEVFVAIKAEVMEVLEESFK
jgi:hypothetical protein